MYHLTKITAVSSLMVLAACSGGSSSESIVAGVSGSAVTDFLTAGPDVVTVNGAVASADGTEAVNGNLDRVAQTLSFGDFSGNINADGTQISDGIDTQNLASEDFEYLRTYTDGSRSGIFGVATAVADVPTGTASYDGTSAFVLIDDSGLYELDGTASTDVDFTAGTLNTTMSGLSGTFESGMAATTDIADAGTVSITGMQIVQNGFSGGELAIDSSVITSTATNVAAFNTIGDFYGPDGEEIGGAFQLDDRAGGEQFLFGTFTGK